MIKRKVQRKTKKKSIVMLTKKNKLKFYKNTRSNRKKAKKALKYEIY